MRSSLIDRVAALETRTARAPWIDLAAASDRLLAWLEAHAAGLPLPAMPPQQQTAEGDAARQRLLAMLARRDSAQEARHATV